MGGCSRHVVELLRSIRGCSSTAGMRAIKVNYLLDAWVVLTLRAVRAHIRTRSAFRVREHARGPVHRGPCSRYF